MHGYVEVKLYFFEFDVRLILSKVSKHAKIRNRNNQVPHMTQDTNGKVANSQSYTTNESQEVSRFNPWARRGHHASPKDSLGVVYYCSLDTLIKNQDGNTRYRGSHPTWFQDGRHEKRQNA